METGDRRKLELDSWAGRILGKQVSSGFSLQPASDDASFRRYFRYSGDISFIFVDAPPEMEDSRPFVHVAGLMRKAGLNVPVVLDSDLDQGFMMLTDLGSTLYLDRLAMDSAVEIERLYRDAFISLVRLQRIESSLPLYDENLLRSEMDLFPNWFMGRKLGIENHDTILLEQIFKLMVENAQAQPQVFVHRDYHCRNLMVTEDNNPGIIDFQDAVVGPVTYDLVSLLKDCYHKFPRNQVEKWVEGFRQRLLDDGRLHNIGAQEFMRWFDFMGFQRHLKCAGIFSRLQLRDGKDRYLADIPLIIHYMIEVCECYEELSRFGYWLNEEILPRVKGFKSPLSVLE